MALAVVPTVALALVGGKYAFLLLAAFALALGVRTALVGCESGDKEWLVVNRFSTRRFKVDDVDEYGTHGFLGVGPAGLSLRLRGSRRPFPFLVEATMSAGTSKGVDNINRVMREARLSFRSARFIQPS